MALTPHEIKAQYENLASVAQEYGVTASTLAQYVDCAGSYSSLTTRPSNVPRKLPPRASADGVLVAYHAAQAIGSPNARAVVVRWQKLRKGEEFANTVSGALVDGTNTSGSWGTSN